MRETSIVWNILQGLMNPMKLYVNCAKQNPAKIVILINHVS